MNAVLIALHLASIVGLALYGLLGFLTLWLFIRHRRDDLSLVPVAAGELPSVTVQLPIYNEREVVRRLIDAAAALDYPQDRLEIQVLDDSTDDTTGLAADCVTHYRAQGTDVSLIHRHNRRGFKAGALAEALPVARGEFLAIFDADFVPTPDFLLRAMPYFLADSGLGAVQARWGHLNAANSGLTGAQAVALDKHFSIEQVVRHRADYFPKFNGSAGIWRRDCILDSGGWQDDTVCEDLCLSTRAVLSGWRFHFAHDLVAPAELPATILAYKTQQARWATGATQCLTKYARSIWQADQYPLIARLYALLSMAAYSTHALLLLLLLVQLPLLLIGQRLPSWFMLFSLLGLGQPILFILAQQTLYRDWRRRLRHFPTLLLVAIGLAPSNTWAVLRALFARDFTFARTPKGPQRSYRLTTGRMLAVELLLTIYSATALVLALLSRNTGPVFLLAASLLGFAYVAILGIAENRAKT
jgi:cellulose synthase/poly-beta-1,6-N-acetylglucosamine synthase-like glycosyltransferase